MRYTELLLGELSGKLAKDSALNIARFHREQASPEFHRAALYVKGELERMGLEEIEIEQFPADGKKKYGMYTAVVAWRIDGGEMWMVEPERRLLARYEESPISIVTYSQKTDVTAEVVDVGRGDRDQDYDGKGVSGKIALVSAEPALAHVKAIKRGAVGLVCHPPWERAAEYPDLVRYYRLRPNGVKRDDVTFGFSISDRQYQELRRLMDSGKTVKVHCRVDAEMYDGSMDILTAAIKGKEKTDEEIILIAHLCHARTCTNDNASGSGTLLEIARTISKLVRAGKLDHPRRTIRFMWVPEINGTAAWMTAHEKQLRKTLACINLDMVGEHPVTVGRPINIAVAPDSTPTFLNDLLAALLKEVADDPRGVAMEGWPYGLNYRIEKFSGGSDHLLFADEYFGIPSVMFYNPDQFHHTTFDDASRIDSTKMKRIGVVVAEAAITIASADEKGALQLAAMTHANGIGRVGETAAGVISKMLETADGTDLADLARTLGRAYVRGLRKVEEAARREASAVLAAGKLAEDRGTFRTLAEDLAQLSRTEKRRISEIYKKLCGGRGIDRRTREDSEAIEAKRLIPIRLYEGPTKTIRPAEIDDEIEKKWLSEFEARTNPHRNYTLPQIGPTLEMMNFADGRRSLYDIAIAVSTEYVDIDISDVKRYIDLFVKRGLVKYAKN